jgi:hypothetical protein
LFRISWIGVVIDASVDDSDGRVNEGRTIEKITRGGPAAIISAVSGGAYCLIGYWQWHHCRISACLVCPGSLMDYVQNFFMSVNHPVCDAS